jgi:hypothetical protein
MRERRLPEVAGTRNVNPKPRWTHYRNSYFFLARQYLGPLCQCPCLGAGRGMMGARPGVQPRSLVGRYETSPSFEIAAGLFAIAAWVAILGYAFYRML